jgi:hypothetical protein
MFAGVVGGGEVWRVRKWRSGVRRGNRRLDRPRRYGREGVKRAAALSGELRVDGRWVFAIGGSVAATKVVLGCYLDKDDTAGVRFRWR